VRLAVGVLRQVAVVRPSPDRLDLLVCAEGRRLRPQEHWCPGGVEAPGVHRFAPAEPGPLLGSPGAFAIKTKWSAEAWNLTKPDERIYRAVSQAEESARDFRLWQPVKQAGVGTVRPLVVLWGSYAASLSEVDSASVNGVPVIAGLSLGRWFQNLNGDSLNPETLEQAWSAIDRHARTRDTADDKRQPVPISVQRLVITSSLTAAGGALGLLAAAKLLSLIGSLYVWVPACLVLMGAAVPIGRWKPARHPALAWQAAVFATLVLAAAVVGVHIVV